MKVVHVSTYSGGGAGVAAYRIHEALLKKGIDSSFLYLINNKSLRGAVQFQPNEKNILKKVETKIKNRLQRHLKIAIRAKAVMQSMLKKISPGLQCENASLPFSDYDILEHPLIQQADIIHLHWIAGFLDYPSFLKKNKKSVVWTLHDMNPFLGLFHYRNDEEKNNALAFDLNEKVIEIKQKAIGGRKGNLFIVSPSQWLLEDAVMSKVFNNVKGYNIAYTLDTEIFSRHPEPDLRQTLEIPKENTIFLFVSERVENYRKGFDILIKTMNSLKDYNITLLVIGNATNLEIPGLDIRILGTINDNKLLSYYYSLADAFIIPSREDNLPNVMLEAMACGTPVLSYNIGGMGEIIQDYFNGLTANEINADALKRLIENFIVNKEKFDRNEIRSFVLNNFSNDITSTQYLNLYEQILQTEATKSIDPDI